MIPEEKKEESDSEEISEEIDESEGESEEEGEDDSFYGRSKVIYHPDLHYIRKFFQAKLVALVAFFFLV